MRRPGAGFGNAESGVDFCTQKLLTLYVDQMVSLKVELVLELFKPQHVVYTESIYTEQLMVSS